MQLVGGWFHNIISYSTIIKGPKSSQKEAVPAGNTFRRDQRVWERVFVCGVAVFPRRMPIRLRSCAPSSSLTFSMLAIKYSQLKSDIQAVIDNHKMLTNSLPICNSKWHVKI